MQWTMQVSAADGADVMKWTMQVMGDDVNTVDYTRE